MDPSPKVSSLSCERSPMEGLTYSRQVASRFDILRAAGCWADGSALSGHHVRYLASMETVSLAHPLHRPLVILRGRSGQAGGDWTEARRPTWTFDILRAGAVFRRGEAPSAGGSSSCERQSLRSGQRGSQADVEIAPARPDREAGGYP